MAKALLLVPVLALVAVASAKNGPETASQVFAGKFIFSDKPIPKSGSSASAYISELHGLNLSSIHYGSNHKLKLYYRLFLKSGHSLRIVEITFFRPNDTARHDLYKTSARVGLGQTVLWGSFDLDESSVPASLYQVEATAPGLGLAGSGQITLKKPK